ncbi:hypothetical protein EJ08DRAFT_363212 [Tothia fuscella]|uniref:Uncharacterized protein n=1 Tax=Tothia fuscella TaxID=1048955 RepID=A0A9P4TWH5_9PEZI|nr:hypothetical protein EJ08DRAFT_363212 [Tothia fuscella]
MQFPKLTLLQSRFSACLGTSILLFIIYYSISPSHFAYAAEIDSIHNEDHNHHRIPVLSDLQVAGEIDWEDVELDTSHSDGTAQYQAEFQGLSRGIIGRALENQFALKNNVPSSLNIRSGEVQYYVFENSSVWGNYSVWRTGLPEVIARGNQEIMWKRDIEAGAEEDGKGRLVRKQSGNEEERMVYISVNTCMQPQPPEGMTDVAPQLTLYVSQDDNNAKPGPDMAGSQQLFPLNEGYVEAKVNVTKNVYMSISASNTTAGQFAGEWNYVITASIDASYYYYNDTTPFLWTIDTDSTSALIATYNLTSENATNATLILRKEWMKMQVPFNMFVYNSSSPAVNGIRNSYCGLEKLEKFKVEGNMTERGPGSNPKQQFYIQDLKPGQKYTGLMTYNGVKRDETDSGSGIPGGGGQIWQAMEFTTKADGNCRVIFDLPFCTDVAYAVPTNPRNPDLSSAKTLALTYDNYSASLFTNFTWSLDQIPCNTTNSAQYSLARNCDDCARDYKTWLCAVTIPRCTDFSLTNPFLAPRNIGQSFPNGTKPDLAQFALNSTMLNHLHYNSSRNPMIDDVIKPGPYKELLPCKELCYDMVQSCPMALGFGCPKQKDFLAMSYGDFDRGAIAVEGENAVTCNYLGVDWPTLSAGTAIGSSTLSLMMAAVVSLSLVV